MNQLEDEKQQQHNENEYDRTNRKIFNLHEVK